MSYEKSRKSTCYVQRLARWAEQLQNNKTMTVNQINILQAQPCPLYGHTKYLQTSAK